MIAPSEFQLSHVSSWQRIPQGDEAWRVLAALRVDFAINEGRNALARTENCGVVGDAMPVAAEF